MLYRFVAGRRPQEAALLQERFVILQQCLTQFEVDDDPPEFDALARLAEELPVIQAEIAPMQAALPALLAGSTAAVQAIDLALRRIEPLLLSANLDLQRERQTASIATASGIGMVVSGRLPVVAMWTMQPRWPPSSSIQNGTRQRL